MNNYQLITTPDALARATTDLTQYAAIGLDTETTALDPYRGRLRLVQLAAPDVVYLIDLYQFGDNHDNLRESDALAPLRELLNAARPVKIAHNAKFDAKWLRHHLGVALGGVFDTLLASQLISAGDTDDRHNLAAVVARYLNQTLDKAEQLSDWNAPTLTENQLRYAVADAAILPPLREKLIERLRKEGLVKVAQIEFECVMPLTDLELAGFGFDATRWREQMRRVEIERNQHADELQEMLTEGVLQGSLFGRPEINLDAPSQINAALKRLGVPMPESTRSWKLQPLAADYPVIAKLLEYRAVQKSVTSFGETFLGEIHPATGRLHADFRQIGAPSGRMACSSPNIQQIPHDAAYRRCFRAPTGRKLIIADYSQVELRILADFSGDRGFITAFQSGADLHRATAAQVFGIAPEDVTPQQRGFAKQLNFGIVYGIGAPRFAMSTGLSLQEADALMKRYFATYRGLADWLNQAAAVALRERQARTAAGRLVRFRYDENDRQAVSLTQRLGKNIPIQGTASDLFKRAMRLVYNDLQGTSAEMVNVVHDEIIVECDASDAPESAARVEQAMCAAGAEFIKTVPVKVEAQISDEWRK